MTNTKIEKAVEEFVKNVRANFDPLHYKVCSRDLSLNNMLEYMVPQYRKALLTAHQQGKKEGDEEWYRELLDKE